MNHHHEDGGGRPKIDMRTARDDALDERLVPRAAVDDVLEALRRVEDHDLVAPVGRVAGPRELRHLLDGELVADVEAGVVGKGDGSGSITAAADTPVEAM